MPLSSEHCLGFTIIFNKCQLWRAGQTGHAFMPAPLATALPMRTGGLVSGSLPLSVHGCSTHSQTGEVFQCRALL